MRAAGGTETVHENAFDYEFTSAGETIRFAVTIPYKPGFLGIEIVVTQRALKDSACAEQASQCAE